MEVDNLQREKPGPSLGLLSSSKSGFLVEGALSSAERSADHCGILLHRNPLQKIPLQGLLGQKQRSRGEWGMGTELSESRVWPRPDFQATKAPSFPRASIGALQSRGPRRKQGKWRARPLDQTGNAFFLSSGGSGMSLSWRQDTSGLRGNPHPAGTTRVDGRPRVTQTSRVLVDPGDTLFG